MRLHGTATVLSTFIFNNIVGYPRYPICFHQHRGFTKHVIYYQQHRGFFLHFAISWRSLGRCCFCPRRQAERPHFCDPKWPSLFLPVADRVCREGETQSPYLETVSSTLRIEKSSKKDIKTRLDKGVRWWSDSFRVSRHPGEISV
jgi:hypothetical protein